MHLAAFPTDVLPVNIADSFAPAFLAARGLADFVISRALFCKQRQRGDCVVCHGCISSRTIGTSARYTTGPVVLNRGPWTPNDLKTPRVSAIQFYNGVRDKGYYRGKDAWIRLLLEGRRVFAFGGNDAHGDLNRKRTMDVPLMSVTEVYEHIFGNVRTVVRAKSAAKDDILDALANGRAVVTDGPFIDISLSRNGRIYQPGDAISAENPEDDKIKTVITASFVSTPEFGCLKNMIILGGPVPNTITKITGEKKELTKNGEIVLFEQECSNRKYSCEYSEPFRIEGFLYVRAECETEKCRICITNPVWIDSPDSGSA